MKLVAYFRVSTTKQGISNLGLEAQEAAIEAFAARRGGTIVARFKEVESGRKSDRPQLQLALAHTQRCRGVLVVAKLDRLSRDAAFLLTLQNGKVPFVAVDNENANELTIGLLAVIAQHEAKMISQRTIDALAAAKRRGTKLGSSREGHWQGIEDARRLGGERGRLVSAKVRSIAAQNAREAMKPIFNKLIEQRKTLSQMAAYLNEQGFLTRLGKPWTKVSVCRFLKGVLA